MRSFATLAIPVLVGAGLTFTPLAGADCTSAGGTTICSQGDVRGANSGAGPSGSSGPSVPYACDYDYYDYDYDYYGCDNDWDLDLDIGWNPVGPGGPGIDRPGGPGGPNIGGGGGRGGRGR